MVAIAPFKFGALAHAVTAPTRSTVNILGGLLICMWNYMGWDNASTIATAAIGKLICGSIRLTGRLHSRRVIAGCK